MKLYYSPVACSLAVHIVAHVASTALIAAIAEAGYGASVTSAAATVLVPVGSVRVIEFVPTEPGDWAMHRGIARRSRAHERGRDRVTRRVSNPHLLDPTRTKP